MREGKRGEHGRTRRPDGPFGCNRRGLVQGIGRGQRATTVRAIGAVLRGATTADVVCSDLRSLGRGLHAQDRGRRAIFQATCSPAVNIIRRQIAVSFLRRRPCVRPYVCVQIQRGDVAAYDASPSHEQVGLCPMQCLLCTAWPACHVVLLNAWRACMHTVVRWFADACFLMPILADHAGGAARWHAVRVVRAGACLRPRRPSGHSRKEESARQGTAKEEVVQ
jgi:hypothetical protein